MFLIHAILDTNLEKYIIYLIYIYIITGKLALTATIKASVSGSGNLQTQSWSAIFAPKTGKSFARKSLKRQDFNLSRLTGTHSTLVVFGDLLGQI